MDKCRQSKKGKGKYNTSRAGSSSGLIINKFRNFNIIAKVKKIHKNISQIWR